MNVPLKRSLKVGLNPLYKKAKFIVNLVTSDGQKVQEIYPDKYDSEEEAKLGTTKPIPPLVVLKSDNSREYFYLKEYGTSTTFQLSIFAYDHLTPTNTPAIIAALMLGNLKMTDFTEGVTIVDRTVQGLPEDNDSNRRN